MPEYAIISCAANNSYGHPHESTLSKLRDADVTVYRTDMQGTITCVSDGETVSFTVEKNEQIQTNPTVNSDEGVYYIGNVRSHKFHRPDCIGLPVEDNRVTFASRSEAVNAGYEPCGRCKP